MWVSLSNIIEVELSWALLLMNSNISQNVIILSPNFRNRHQLAFLAQMEMKHFKAQSMESFNGKFVLNEVVAKEVHRYEQ